MSTDKPVHDGGGTIGGGGSPDPQPPLPPTVTPTPTPTPSNPSVVPAIIASSAAAGGSITLDRIPLVAQPSQSTFVQLGAQSARIDVFQKRTGMFLNLYVNDAPIVLGAICLDRIWIVRDAYVGFNGDLAFVDTQGASDPDYTGLAERFQLLWGH